VHFEANKMAFVKKVLLLPLVLCSVVVLSASDASPAASLKAGRYHLYKWILNPTKTAYEQTEPVITEVKMKNSNPADIWKTFWQAIAHRCLGGYNCTEGFV
jgi:hypothetical protein